MFDAAAAEVSPQRWAVAITAPRAERIAKQQAQELGIDAFLPLRERPPTLDRPIVVEPLWGGYLFLRTSTLPEIEPDVPAIRAVRGLIATADGRTIFSPTGLVERLIERADKDGILEKFVEPQQYTPTVGDQIRLLYGVFAGQFAIVQWFRDQAVKLELSCASSLIMINARLEQIEPVT